jgi:hypothetical protein
MGQAFGPDTGRRCATTAAIRLRSGEDTKTVGFADAHLSDDETVAKMGHPDLWWVKGVTPWSAMKLPNMGHPLDFVR